MEKRHEEGTPRDSRRGMGGHEPRAAAGGDAAAFGRRRGGGGGHEAGRRSEDAAAGLDREPAQAVLGGDEPVPAAVRGLLGGVRRLREGEERPRRGPTRDRQEGGRAPRK